MFVRARRNYLNAMPLHGSSVAVKKGTAAPSSADRLVELYATYGAVVYARCRQVLGEAAAAEDITQDTFLRVHRHIDALPEADAVLPWLYRIATNLCLNALRDGRVRPVPVAELPDRPGVSLDEL